MATESSHNPYTAPASHPGGIRGGNYAFLRNPRPLTHLLLGLLVIFLAKNLFFHIEYYFLRPETRSYDYPLVVILNILVTLGTYIIFGMWIHRAASNSRGFGARGMRCSPAGAVGWYFIPIMNLFRPYQAMKQIWQVSGDPEHWEKQKGSPILITWWILWLAYQAFIILASTGKAYLEPLRSFPYSYLTEVTKMSISALLTIFAIILVSTIHRRQQALVS